VGFSGGKDFQALLAYPLQTPLASYRPINKDREYMGQRKRIDLHCMYLPDDIGSSNAIDWGRYETQRKKKPSKGNRRLERSVKAIASGGGVGGLGAGRNESVAGSECG
jgi:hypothetical protein